MEENDVKLEKLAPRERQVVETVCRLEEAAVGEVLAAMEKPPSYSAVRAMLTTLVQKGYLTYRREKTKYLYRPAFSKDTAQKSVLRNLLDNFFAGNPAKAVAALLDLAGNEMDENDYAQLKQLIEQARKENR